MFKEPFQPEYNDEPSVRLVGIRRPLRNGDPIEWDDWPFRSSRFRPLAERKTDISTFTAMLNIKQRELSQ